MNQDTIQRIEALLLGNVAAESRESVESRFPVRNLPKEAIVTRSAPSPTGFVHIGTIYMCLLNQFLARQTSGVYMLRIEDTDKKREITDGIEQIINALNVFGLVPDEGVGVDGKSYGNYGPYLQSERKSYYLTYALELLKNGYAYPCFATKEELDESYEQQQADKVRPGYYGKWALWRDKTEVEINKALDSNKAFVLRFRSNGNHEKRIAFDDVLKGHLELPENDLDVPLIKADGSQLPTYHLAHVVDDHLMKSNIILRGDEWLPSTPLHIELTAALGVMPFNYAHFAPISVTDKTTNGKRKLSKRKDPEADVQYWLSNASAGVPIYSIKAYLLSLASSDFDEWYRANPQGKLEDFKIKLERLAASRAPLLDMNKLYDYSKDYIATLPQEEFEKQLMQHAHASSWSIFEDAVTKDTEYAHKVFSIERGGDKPRKDLKMWGEADDVYGYFFDEIFEHDFKESGRREFLSELADDVIKQACQEFLKAYDSSDEQTEWFDKLKSAAETCGFALDNKVYKANPEQFKGNVADFAKILRVKLTGKDRTPDLYLIMQVMGSERVKARLS